MKIDTPLNILINYLLENFALTDETINKFEELKELEKKHIEMSFDIGFSRGYDCGNNHDWHEGRNKGEQYYNQFYLGMKIDDRYKSKD